MFEQVRVRRKEWEGKNEKERGGINENNTLSYTQQDNKQELWKENIEYRI